MYKKRDRENQKENKKVDHFAKPKITSVIENDHTELKIKEIKKDWLKLAQPKGRKS